MNLGLKLEEVRKEVLKFLGTHEQTLYIGTRYITPEAQRATDRAAKETEKLGHPSIGTGHILLGLLYEEGGMAARLLAKLGVRAEMVREEVEKHGGRELET
jgi:ATP-dependent Clp protease ATP-binding subunit ClpC